GKGRWGSWVGGFKDRQAVEIWLVGSICVTIRLPTCAASLRLYCRNPCSFLQPLPRTSLMVDLMPRETRLSGRHALLMPTNSFLGCPRATKASSANVA